MAEGRIIETKIPARLDRLPWARWHWMVLIGLGTVWILDGTRPSSSPRRRGRGAIRRSGRGRFVPEEGPLTGSR